jgi:hypothetical protein
MIWEKTACSALGVFLLAASPCWAMSVVTAPSNSNGASRFSDPNTTQRRPFSGGMTTVIIGNGSSFGFGGGVTAGNSPFGSRGYDNGSLGNRILGPGDPFPSNNASPFPDPGFPNSAPPGFNQDNPFFDPRGAYAPNLRGYSR